MIHQREISKKAYQEQKQDRVIEKDYVITWLLLGISRSPLEKLLAFKGGTALKKLYFKDYRYSEDLDFTVLEKTRREKLQVYLSGVFNDLEKEAALAFQRNEGTTEERADSTTLYVQFAGPLQGVTGSRDFKLDFTFNEKLVYPLSRRRILASYSDCAGVDRTLAAYSLEEILVEKLCALIGRTEPRDLYDAHFLLRLGNIDYLSVPEGFKSKAEHKGIDPRKISTALLEREPTMSRLWDNRLSLQVDALPQFKRVLRETKQALKQFELI